MSAPNEQTRLGKQQGVSFSVLIGARNADLKRISEASAIGVYAYLAELRSIASECEIELHRRKAKLADPTDPFSGHWGEYSSKDEYVLKEMMGGLLVLFEAEAREVRSQRHQSARIHRLLALARLLGDAHADALSSGDVDEGERLMIRIRSVSAALTGAVES